MAVEQTARRQLACKVVDIRKLRPSMTIGRSEHPAAADEVDSRAQVRKVREWGGKKKKGTKLEDKLKAYTREFEILTSTAHVRSASCRFSQSNVFAAKHHRTREGLRY